MNPIRTLMPAMAALTLAGSALHADAQTISAGVYGGANIARAATDADATEESRTGLVVGAAFEVSLISPLTFRAEAQYVQKGGKLEYTSTTSTPTVTTDYTLNYLDIPINLKLDLGSDEMPLYLFAGTTVGTLLTAVANETVENEPGHEHDIKSQFNSVDLSLDLGGGIGYQIIPHIDLIADLRYSMGLTDIAKEENQLLSADSWKTRNIKIVVGMYLGL